MQKCFSRYPLLDILFKMLGITESIICGPKGTEQSIKHNADKSGKTWVLNTRKAANQLSLHGYYLISEVDKLLALKKDQ